MPGKGTAAKRHRQSLRRRVRNKMIRSRVRSSTRKFAELAQASSTEQAGEQYREVSSLLDRAVSKGVIHRNAAARKKHRLHRILKNLAKPA